MKNTLILFLAFLAFSSFAQNDSDVLMTIGDKKVTVGEFKYIYEKNNKDNADYKKKTIDEYLDLYKKFKLKVVDAETNKLNEDETITNEIGNYKNQLSSSYYKENILLNDMAKEVFDRKQHDIRVSHILVERNEAKIKEALKKLNNGERFEKLVKEYSSDEYTINNGGDLGYLTAMLQPGFYELENAIYNTPVGKTSGIVRSPLGYHIIKVTDKRKSKGKIQVAQIAINKQKNVTPGQPTAKQLIDQAYQELNEHKGKNWNSLVKQYSSDRSLVLKNGELPFFGQGEYEDSFENAAFSLKQNGDYSKPIETTIGYHIIKRLDKKQYNTFDKYLSKEAAGLKRSKRYSYLKSNFRQKLLSSGNYQLNEKALQLIKSSIGNNFNSKGWKAPKLKNETLFSFADKKYSNNQLLKYIEENPNLRLSKRSKPNTVVDIILKRYLNKITQDYLHNKLSGKYIDYANLFREYKEGILLFESTKRNVWDKAANDSDGIEQYYNTHKDNYTYNDRSEVVTYLIKKGFKGNKQKFIKTAKKAKKSPESIVKKFDSKKEFITFTINTVDTKTVSTTQQITNKGEQLSVILKKLPARHKKLDECKGFVIADYQNKIEKDWLEKLENKYPVVVNQKIYKALIK